MTVKASSLAVVLAAAWFWAPAWAQDRVDDLRARFLHEPNAINRAKLMGQLGDAEFAEIDRDVMQDKIAEALEVLRSYRDEVGSCDKALSAMGLDAEKHPNGFKQLQFSVRDSLRRLDTLTAGMAADEQAPFLEIRKGLGETNRHLMEKLFPRAPSVKPEPGAKREKE